jgi:hypothetical protein
MLTRPKTTGYPFLFAITAFRFSWQARAAPVHKVGKVRYT